jgi:serine/threonine protein kinase
VVKLPSRSPGLAAESRARLLRERELLARMANPAVLRLLDGGWDAGSGEPFLVVEYHPAGSLARWLEQRYVVELGWALGVATGALRALAYLHEGLRPPIAHRDLSPRNLLLRPDRARVVLIDFGLARPLGRHRPPAGGDITTRPVYSPFYAAPETVAGDRWCGPATDVYGLCAILYELVTGLPPYCREATSSGRDFAGLVLDPAVTPLPAGRRTPGLPRALDELLAAGLAADPAARPGRAMDLVPLLEELGRRHGRLRVPFADLRGHGRPAEAVGCRRRG